MQSYVYLILKPHVQVSRIPDRLLLPLWCQARQIQKMYDFKIKFESFITSPESVPSSCVRYHTWDVPAKCVIVFNLWNFYEVNNMVNWAMSSFFFSQRGREPLKGKSGFISDSYENLEHIFQRMTRTKIYLTSMLWFSISRKKSSTPRKYQKSFNIKY